MVNMNKFRYLRIFTLGLHSYINRTFHPVPLNDKQDKKINVMLFRVTL